MQILPGIYQVNGSPYGQHQNSYLIRRSGATVLVDSGDMHQPTLHEVERNLMRWGVRVKEVTHLFVTHEHFYHASHAAELKRRGVKVVASPQAAAMAAADERCIGYAVQREFEPCKVDDIIEDGATFTVGDLTLRCIAAPGH
jgi:glyoxylase-like metal-dependent hydrolase (beta-lactamase superfamily II)